MGFGPSLAATALALGHDAAKVAGTVPGSRGYAKKARKHGFRSDDDVVRPLVESYRHSYGPLFRGDIGEFAHRLYENPLGPILDAATVVSLGAGGAAKAGLAPAAIRRGTLELRGPNGRIISKALPKQTLRAELQVGRKALLDKLPRGTRYLGEDARFARQEKRAPHKLAQARELQETPFLKALSKLRSRPERTAAFWISQVPLADDLGRLAKQLEDAGGEQALATAAMLRDPKFLENYLTPSTKITRTIDEAAGVAEAQKAILGISDDVARQRAYLPTLLARGARLEKIEGERALIPPPGGMEKAVRPRNLSEAKARLEKLDAEIERIVQAMTRHELDMNPEGYRLASGTTKAKRGGGYEVPSDEVVRRKHGGQVDIQRSGEKAVYVEANEGAYTGPAMTMRDLARREAERKLMSLDDPHAAKFREWVDEAAELRKGIEREEAPAFMADIYDEGYGSLGETTELRPAPGFASIDEMIAKIDADLEAAGRPKPVYMPHTSERPKPLNIYGTGGRGPQRDPSPLKQTMGVLLSRGQIIADPQVLRTSFVKSIKWALYRDIHALHLKNAVRLPIDEAVPKGWQVVRRRHGEQTPYTAKTAGEFNEFAKENLSKDAGFEFRDNPFTTPNAADAFVLEEQGVKYRMIVPTEFSRQLAGEFTRAGSFARYMNAYPLRVWRHLVLKLRPAWLINNILGNTLLYFIHNADPIAVQEFARTFRALTPRKQHGAFDELMRKHFPEQVHGTFMGSQLPVFGGYGKLAKMERVSSFVGAGLAQVDRAWEAGLRSSVVRAELRKSPELRKFAGKIRRQTDDFWKLADEELAKNPLLAEKITDRVNDAFGDYLALGRVERDVIRSVFPFYAWYRVITLITLKLPLTHPLKAQLLARIGQAGTQSALEDLGLSDEEAISTAKGFFSFGKPDKDGRIRGLSTKSGNPFATVADLEEFVGALAQTLPSMVGVGKRPGYNDRPAWSVLPGLNPLFKVPIESLTDSQQSNAGILGAIPEWALLLAVLNKHYEGDSTLYDRDREDQFLRYAGVPYARISPERIKELSR